MTRRRTHGILALAGLIIVTALPARAEESQRMPTVARGSFTVAIKPVGEPVVIDGVSTGRMAVDKQFEGDLSGTSTVDMLTAMSPIKGSAGYVAIERCTCTLAGRSGTFVFQHSGTMQDGAQQLSITVVPGTGTGQLQGLAGTFRLQIVDGRHLYEFEYSLPALPAG